MQANLQGLIAQREYHVGRALSICAALIKLTHALSLLESESLEAVESYFDNLWVQSRTSKTRAVKDIVQDFQVRAAYSLVKKCVEKEIERARKKYVKCQGLTPFIKGCLINRKKVFGTWNPLLF